MSDVRYDGGDKVSAERIRVRQALSALGYDRVSYTEDQGNGSYAERWQNANLDNVVLAWAPRQSRVITGSFPADD